jgi:Immunoglobulin I-set domain
VPSGKIPRFPKKPTIRQEGDILVMECVLEANPKPEITWFRGSTRLAEGQKRLKFVQKETAKDTYLIALEISV